MNQRMRLICLSAVVLVVGCGAVRTDPRPQQQLDNGGNHGYGEQKATNEYNPMKFDMSSGGAASNNVMYTSGASPGAGALYTNSQGNGGMLATAGHPYAYEEAAPASTYVIPSYAEEHHAVGFGGGGYLGVPQHKPHFLPGHKYRPHGLKLDLHNDPSYVSPWRKVFKVLTAAIPIGLFIAALPPNIVHINATQHTKPLGTVQKQRSGDDPNTVETFPVLDMIEERGGLRALRNENCEANLFCEIAKMGKSAEANSVQQAFWGLVNETPDSLAELFGTRELFKAIRTDACDIYKCPTD